MHVSKKLNKELMQHLEFTCGLLRSIVSDAKHRKGSVMVGSTFLLAGARLRVLGACVCDCCVLRMLGVGCALLVLHSSCFDGRGIAGVSNVACIPVLTLIIHFPPPLCATPFPLRPIRPHGPPMQPSPSPLVWLPWCLCTNTASCTAVRTCVRCAPPPWVSWP